jgi:hypothetical protein
MLPEANAGFRYDDVQEDAINVSGEVDGKFDDGDYVQFAPSACTDGFCFASETCAKFNHILNLYSDTTFYF